MKTANYPNRGEYAQLENATLEDRKSLMSSGYTLSHHGDGKCSIYIPQDSILAWLLCSRLQTLGFQLTTGKADQ